MEILTNSTAIKSAARDPGGKPFYALREGASSPNAGSHAPKKVRPFGQTTISVFL